MGGLLAGCLRAVTAADSCTSGVGSSLDMEKKDLFAPLMWEWECGDDDDAAESNQLVLTYLEFFRAACQIADQNLTDRAAKHVARGILSGNGQLRDPRIVSELRALCKLWDEQTVRAVIRKILVEYDENAVEGSVLLCAEMYEVWYIYCILS